MQLEDYGRRIVLDLPFHHGVALTADALQHGGFHIGARINVRDELARWITTSGITSCSSSGHRRPRSTSSWRISGRGRRCRSRSPSTSSPTGRRSSLLPSHARRWSTTPPGVGPIRGWRPWLPARQNVWRARWTISTVAAALDANSIHPTAGRSTCRAEIASTDQRLSRREKGLTCH